MTKIHNPHDRYFRTLMAKPEVAQEFFAKHLPDKIKRVVDLKGLQLQHNSYIGDGLQEQIVDLLYSADFSGLPGYIYVLVEHQSTPEKLMPFRMLKYMVAIMEDHLEKTGGNTLPIIYPIIMYSGTQPYNYSTDLFDLFENKELALEILWQPYQLVDILKTSAKEFDEFLWYGTLAKAMKYIHKYRKNSNYSATRWGRTFMGNLERKSASKCSHTNVYAALFRCFFVQPCLITVCPA